MEPQFGGAILSRLKKTPVRKAPARKQRAKGDDELVAGKAKASVKKAPVRKAPVRKAPVRKAPVRKAPVRKAPVSKAPVRKAPVRKQKAKGDDNLIAGAVSNKELALHKKANTVAIKDYKKRLADMLKQEKQQLIEQGFDEPYITKYIKDRRKAISDKLKNDLFISSTQIYESMR
jgi:hypothetical protein